MNKKVFISIVVVLALLVSGALAYVALRPKDTATVTTTTSKTEVSQQAAHDTTPSATPGVYTAYDASKITSTDGVILLFFHAPWCPQCRAIEQSINDDGVPDDVTVYKVDYDSNQALRQKYGVTIQTTFVKVDTAGNKLGSYVAYSEPTFAAVERELLH